MRAWIHLPLLAALGCHGDHPHGAHAEGAPHGEHADHAPASQGPPADHREPEGVVRLSAVAQERAGIRVAAVTVGGLRGSLEVPAEVQLNPDRVAHISPLLDGMLLEVHAAVGDRVEPRQPLARLRSVALGQARAELSRTTALRTVARKALARQRKLRADRINSERSLAEARAAFDQATAEREAAFSRLQVFGLRGGQGPDMDLISPIEGLVVDRHATRGESVSPDDTLFVVADVTRMWIIGRVYEQQIAQVAAGMTAHLTLNAYPSRTWTGVVDFVGAQLDARTRTLPIRVEIENADGRLRPGLFGTLRLSAGAGGQAVIVPSTAVQSMDGHAVVFVPGDHPGEYARRVVTLGREGSRRVEVLEGLTATDRVVVHGGFILKSELMRGRLGHGHAH